MSNVNVDHIYMLEALVSAAPFRDQKECGLATIFSMSFFNLETVASMHLVVIALHCCH